MKSKSVAALLTVAAAVTALIAPPFVGLGNAEARQGGKSLKCVSRPVAGTVGTYIWTCSTVRI